MKANLSWSRTRAKFCQLIASLSVILLQFKLTKLTLEFLKSDFQRKKRKIWTQINLQLTGKFRSSSTSAQVCFYNTAPMCKLLKYTVCAQHWWWFPFGSAKLWLFVVFCKIDDRAGYCQSATVTFPGATNCNITSKEEKKQLLI